MFSDMFTFPFRCPSLTVSGSLMTSLAAGGIRNVVRNHGYRSHGFSAILAQHRHGLMTSVGVRRLSNGGRVSSILCLCGFSVSLFFYLFYYKYFSSRSYYSKYLAKAIRRILLRTNGGHLVIAFKTKRSNSASGERSDDVSKTAEGPCSPDGKGDVNRGYLDVPAPSRGPPMRTRRRRTRSESLEVVPERHLDFTRLVSPEVEPDPRYGNVIAWLARIVDPTGEEMVEMVDEELEREGVSGSGRVVSRWRRETDCWSSDSVLPDSEVESRDSGYGKGEEEEESRGTGGGGGGRIEPGMPGLKKRGALPRQSFDISTDFDEFRFDSLLEKRRDNELDNNSNNNKSEKVFYFEKDEDDEDLHFSSSLHEKQPRCNTGQHEQQQQQQHRSSADYESMRARLLGPPTHHRKRTTSTGSWTSGDIFAARGLIRNHFSFNSTTSSGYAYRESLVGKGLSVDGGEDLDRLVLLDADLGRWTLADIDRLQEDLDNIRRDIGDLNWTVDVLRSRDENDDDDDDGLKDFASICNVTGASTLKFGSRSSTPRGCEIQELIRRLDDWDSFAWDNDNDSYYPEFETEEDIDEDEDDHSLGDGQLCRLSLSDCGEDATFSRAVHPLVQYSDVIDDEYIDDGYEVLTHLHR